MRIEWQKSLYWGGKLRKGFRSWAVPKDVREQYLIKDGDEIKARVHLGQQTVTERFLITSGGELQVGAEIADQIKKYGEKNDGTSISFSTSSLPFAVADIDELRSELQHLSETTRDAIISARIGQGLFRERLFEVYKGRCAVTGIDVPELLRASHIKPWCKSNNDERLCADNGLLLVANLDAAFDRRLISFADTGKMLFKSGKESKLRKVLGITTGTGLTKRPSCQKKSYLKFHRKLAGFE